MSITVNKQTLSKALAQITAIVEKRNIVPILANVKIEAENNTLTVVATDLDVEATTSIECEDTDYVVTTSIECSNSEYVATTVNAEMLLGIVKKLPNGDINLTHIDGQLEVKSGRSVFNLGTLPNADFPVMATADYDSTFEIEADELRRLFDLTAFAQSTEETRYYLNGVYLHNVDGKLTTVATDGHRLALANCDTATEIKGVIVPRKTVAEIGKVIETGLVTVSVSETKIKFENGPTVIVSKVVDGSFPDYTRVIPAGTDNIVKVDSSDFAKSIDRVAQVSTDMSRAVKIKASADMIVLESNGGVNSAVDEVACDYSGEETERGVNSRYFAEIMGKVDGVARVSLGETGSPLHVTTDGDDSSVFVLMGMRV